MRILARLVLLLWLGIGTCFGQSSIYVATPGNIYAALNVDIPPVAGQDATSFPIGFVTNVAADSSGNIYFAVEAQNRVYRVTPGGKLFLIAGTDSGYSGDGGPATKARLRSPVAVAIGQSGAVYIADFGNSAIRKISPDGTITTVVQGLGQTSTTPLALDDADNLYVGTQNRLLKISPAGGVTSVAGTGTTGFGGDGGPAINASLNSVAGIAIDHAGNIFISDNQNHRVRKITAGIITTIAGNGFGGYAGDGGPAVAASFSQPRGLAVDNAGNLYVGDYFNHLIRRINAAGNISTIAGRFVGNSPLGSGGFGGDGGPALQALMRNPMGIALDPSGNLFIADSNNTRIRKVVIATGVITTVAGNGLLGGGRDTPFRTIAISSTGEIYLAGAGRMVYRLTPAGLVVFAGTDTFGFAGDGGPATSASFAGPGGLAVDSAGNVYIADSNNNRVRKVSTDGRITTVAGSGLSAFGGDGGPATAASLSGPYALAVDKDGSLYISDTNNRRLRKVTADGIIQTIAGNGQSGFNGDGVATAASIGAAGGIVIDASGAVIISDGNNRIRKITADGKIRTIAGTGTNSFNGDGPALSVNLATPSGLALDSEATLYIADTNSQRVRRMTAGGNVETIAGTGMQGVSGDGGPARLADIVGPIGIAWHPAGALYITDWLNGAIRRIDMQASARFSISNLDAVSAVSPGTGAAASVGYASSFNFSGDRPTGIAVISSRDKGVTVSETTLVAAPAILSGRVAAEVNGPVNTGISLVNPSEAIANVSFFFTNALGDFGTGSLTIGARSQFIAFLTETPFNVRAPLQGTFTFVSSVPLAVAALRGFTNERSEFMATAVPVIDLGAAPLAEPISIAHYASGGGWTTRMTLVNPGDQNISGNIRLTDSGGSVARQYTYALAARGSQTLTVDMDNGTTSVGSALITPAAGASPSAYALLSYVYQGVTLTSTAAAAVPFASALRMFAEISGDVATGARGSAQTGIAIANPSDSPVQVNMTIGPVVTLFPFFPAADERFTVVLPGRGHFSAFLKDILPRSIPLGPLQSVLRIQSSGPISAMGLRTLVNERNELLVSSTPAINENSPTSAGTMFFPMFADSPSFTTRFILFSGTGTSGGAIQFSSSSGQPITLIR